MRIALPLFLLLVCTGIVLHFSVARPGGPDDGLLHLAGVTALVSEGQYPIVQRPPLYALMLSGIAQMMGLSMADRSPVAQQLGDIAFLDVADALMQPEFLRAVLIVQVALWAGAFALMVAALRTLGLHWGWVSLAALAALIPSSWAMIGRVFETILCQFLLMLALFALAHLFTDRPRKAVWIGVAALMLAALGLTHAAFQLLAPVVALVGGVLLWSRRGTALQFTIATLGMWLVLVGGYSLMNITQRGFVGVTGVGGVALSTRTALYVERGARAYPDDAAIFASIRDQVFLDEPQKPNVVYWGARASNWLMRERGLSYLDANQVLVRYNLAVIAAAPLNYLEAVFDGIVRFQFPGVSDQWPTLPRLLWTVSEVVVMLLFWSVVLLWLAVMVLGRLRVVSLMFLPVDRLLTLLLVVYSYAALITSLVDVGKPEQRMAVQFTIPIMIAMAVSRIAGLAAAASFKHSLVKPEPSALPVYTTTTSEQLDSV